METMKESRQFIDRNWLEWYTKDEDEEIQDPLEVLIELYRQSKYNVYLKEYLERVLRSDKRIYVTSHPRIGCVYNTLYDFQPPTPQGQYPES